MVCLQSCVSLFLSSFALVIPRCITFAFDAWKGWDIAERLRQEKAGEVKFNFLKSENPYHAYFLNMVEDVRAGKKQGIEPRDLASRDRVDSICACQVVQGTDLNVSLV